MKKKFDSKSFIFGFIISILLIGEITVYASSLISGADVSYDNTSSGLTSTTVSAALTELYNISDSSSKIKLNIKNYQSEASVPTICSVGDVASITSKTISNYYIGFTEPENKVENMLWMHVGTNSTKTLNVDVMAIPISYTTIYECNGTCKWNLVKTKVCNDATWQDLNTNGEFSFDYGYTGNYQTFTAPYTGTYKIELWGAGYAGAGGSYTSGELRVNEGTTLYVYVGESLTSANPYNKSTIYGPNSYNGGGKQAGANGSSGAGATDIRVVSGAWDTTTSLYSRIMVAAGAGSLGNGNGKSIGGAGGGLVGYDGTCDTGYTIGKGGTQTSGGAQSGGASTKGLFGIGGDGGLSWLYDATYKYPWTGGAGGGGWYGGSGGQGITKGSDHGAGGGGGSSYISGHAGCVGINNDGTSKTSSYSKLEDSYSYTGYIFKNTVMIDGMGYKWTTSKGNKVGLIDPNGSAVNEHISNGYARITLIEL